MKNVTRSHIILLVKLNRGLERCRQVMNTLRSKGLLYLFDEFIVICHAK